MAKELTEPTNWNEFELAVWRLGLAMLNHPRTTYKDLAREMALGDESDLQKVMYGRRPPNGTFITQLVHAYKNRKVKAPLSAPVVEHLGEFLAQTSNLDKATETAMELVGELQSTSEQTVDKFHGRFIRLFIKPKVRGGRALAVHCGDFRIGPNLKSGQAEVRVVNFEDDLKNYGQSRSGFKEKTPRGFLRLTPHNLEMVISYGLGVPDSYFLGALPIAGEVDSFLLMNLDVAFDSYQVGGQAMMFVKIADDFENDDGFDAGPHDSSTRLFGTLSKFLEQHMTFDPKRFELMPAIVQANSTIRLVKVVKELVHPRS